MQFWFDTLLQVIVSSRRMLDALIVSILCLVLSIMSNISVEKLRSTKIFCLLLHLFLFISFLKLNAFNIDINE
jgi:hypothetical protein